MILEIVIAASPPVVVAFNHQVVNEALALGVWKHFACWEEPILEIFYGLLSAFEAGKIILAQKHHLNYNYNLLSIFLQRKEALLHELTILPEVLRAVPTQHLDLLCRQFKGCLLKLDTLAWRVRQEETEVDVDQVTFYVNHDVAVMSILYLEDVADQGVSCKRLAKILSCCFESLASWGTKLVLKVINNPYVLATKLLLDAGYTEWVITDFDEPTPLPSCQYLVWFKPQVQLLGLENLVELTDKLYRKLLLPYVIISFDYNAEEFPGQEVTIWGISPDSLLLFLGCLWKYIFSILFVNPTLHLTGQLIRLSILPPGPPAPLALGLLAAALQTRLLQIN